MSAQPKAADQPAPIEWVRLARDVLARQNSPEIASRMPQLDRYLDLHSTVSLDEALGLIPAPGEEHWRTAARRHARDDELRRLAARFLPGLSVRGAAAEVARLIERYEIRWVRADQHGESMPAGYIGRPEQHLYRAFSTGIPMPSANRLRAILARELPAFDAPLSRSSMSA